MEQEINPLAEWIGDALGAVKGGGSPEASRLIERCGRGCAARAGTLDFMAKLRDEARAAHRESRADLVRLLRERLPIDVTEEADGIVVGIRNTQCNCKMLPHLSRDTDALCHCTHGYQKAMWSEFFGRPVESEIVETILWGGRECVFRIRV